jgi:hypothetical protein
MYQSSFAEIMGVAFLILRTVNLTVDDVQTIGGISTIKINWGEYVRFVRVYATDLHVSRS